MATSAQFENFLTDVQPSSTTSGQISDAQKSVREYLRTHPSFKGVHLFTFLTGSQARDTAIRPRTINGTLAKPDVDIVVVTNHTLTDKPADVLRLLRSVLAQEFTLDEDPHTRSVGLKTSAVCIDVVPIIVPPTLWQKPFTSDMGLGDLADYKLYIPDKKLAEWCETSPPKQLKWATELNKTSSGIFKPTVKLVKWWRRENPTLHRRPKGFVLECMAGECLDPKATTYEDSFVKTLLGMVNRYAWVANSNQTPWIADPGVPTNTVTRSLEPEQFAAFYKKLVAHSEIAILAQQEIDPDKQLALWRKVFGSRFPSAASAVKELLSSPFVPSGLVFPDRPTGPRKPGGFAR